jgi:hypothetical protein
MVMMAIVTASKSSSCISVFGGMSVWRGLQEHQGERHIQKHYRGSDHIKRKVTAARIGIRRHNPFPPRVGDYIMQRLEVSVPAFFLTSYQTMLR